LGGVDFTALRLSLQVAALATGICIAVGLPLAWFLARRRFWATEVLAAAAMLPLVLPPTVIGYYLLTALGRSSAFGRFLEDHLGIRLVFTWQGAGIAAAVMALPLLVMTARAGFESVDPELERVGLTLGRSRLAVFFTITLPLASPGVLAGVALAFARAMGEFGATLMVAGSIPGRTRTMPLAVYDAVQSGDMALANTLALILTLTSMAMLAVFGWTTRSIRS
jgi:molybdate transport system permease protein